MESILMQICLKIFTCKIFDKICNCGAIAPKSKDLTTKNCFVLLCQLRKQSPYGNYRKSQLNFQTRVTWIGRLNSSLMLELEKNA